MNFHQSAWELLTEFAGALDAFAVTLPGHESLAEQAGFARGLATFHACPDLTDKGGALNREWQALNLARCADGLGLATDRRKAREFWRVVGSHLQRIAEWHRAQSVSHTNPLVFEPDHTNPFTLVDHAAS